MIKYLAEYKKWNQKYYESIKFCCHGKDRIPANNPVEQKVLLYEIVGHLTSYAYYLSFANRYDTKARRDCHEIVNSIIELINNYPQFNYAPYDKDIGVISMLYRLLLRLDRAQDVGILIHNQTVQLLLYYRFYRKYPSPEDLADVTKCAWFLRASEESAIYDAYAMNKAGDGVAFEPEKSFEDLKEQITFVMDQYSEEKFSYDTFSFDALEFIASRYYGYLVRVKKSALLNRLIVFHVVTDFYQFQYCNYMLVEQYKAFGLYIFHRY